MVTLMFWAGDEAICFYTNERGCPQSQKDFKTEDEAFDYAESILNNLSKKYDHMTEITIYDNDTGEISAWDIDEGDYF